MERGLLFHSGMRWAMAFMAMVNLAVLGCTRPWPTVQGLADRSFVDHSRQVGALDVLPLDIDFAVATQARGSAPTVVARFNRSARATIERELARRGYRVGAAMEWDGSYVAGDGAEASALETPQIVATAESLRGYGYAQSQNAGGLLFPYLPHRLGDRTGSDATLYVGGWAYVGKKRTSTGAKVAKGVLIGALVVVVVIAVVASIKDGKGGSLLRGTARVAGGAARGAKVIAHSASAAARMMARTSGATLRATARATVRVLDAFGRTNTHIHIHYGGDPEEYERDLPRDGYSRMEIEMTLIDNADGRALWHARQLFEADAASTHETDEVMRRMLASLPARR